MKPITDPHINETQEQGDEPYIGFNDAGYLEISYEASLAMMDELIKVNPIRKVEPLDIFDYPGYGHRIFVDNYNLMLGDSCFIVPPEFISITSESSSQSIVTLRQENSQKIKTGYHKRTIIIDLVFHGVNQINGFKVESPEGFYYVDGLRQLLAQFKCTPFLPIVNSTINTAYDIHTVALQSIICSTVEGFPDLMTANVTLQEVNLFPYIEMHNRWFKYMIDWDLFRFYYQRLLTEKDEYKKLKSVPANKELTSFKISVLSPRVFDTDVSNHTFKEIILDEKIVLTDTDENNKEVKAKSNYETYIDSEVDNIHISEFQCGYSNLLTSIQMSDHGEPTIQYMGGMDTIFSIGFETTDEKIIAAFDRSQIINDQITRGNKKLSSVGFIKLESELVSLCGSRFVMIDNVTTSTVPGFPGLFKVQIHYTSFDINQSDREDLNGFAPFARGYGRESDSIKQSLDGLYNKIKQDNFAERKIRDEYELYPDLKLPTYEEVDNVISKIRTFRSTHKNQFGEPLGQLSYTKYPRSPQKMFHGVKESDNLNLETNDAGVVTNTDQVAESISKYEGYVDPDFYVFYPHTYASISAAAIENGDPDPYTSIHSNKTPEARTKEFTKKIYKDPDNTGSSVSNDYIGPTDLTAAKQNFINLALSKIGSPYVWGAEGPNAFDCSGFISWCLKQIGVLTSRVTTDSMLTRTSIFRSKPLSEALPGDLLHFKAGETKSIGHVAIYLGNNEIVHAGGATEGKSRVNKRKADYVKFVRALEIIPLNNSETVTSTFEPKATYNFNKNVTLKKGDNGSGVKQYQHILNLIDNANLNTDGDFGNLTETAVKSFQRKNGLTQTGIIDKDTISAIEAIANEFTGPSMSENSVSYSYSGSSDNGTISEAELQEIARVVAAESRGETLTGQIAVAQCIYDRVTDPKKRWGNLNDVLYAKGMFAKPWSGNLKTTTCLKAVKDVFCDGLRAYPNDKVHYFLSPGAGISTYKNRNKNYKRLGVIGSHTFWGASGAGSTVKFSSTTGNTTQDTQDTQDIQDIQEGQMTGDCIEETVTITNGVYKIKSARMFGRPVIVKTEMLMPDSLFKDKNKQMKKYINNDINIFNSMYVDMAEYSAKGRLVKAFPTYLFMIQDENGEWLDGQKLWANYYILRSLVDIQVYSSNDMPMSTATITVTNNYDNLSNVPSGMKYYNIKNDDEYKKYQRKIYEKFGIVLGFGPKLTQKMIDLKNIIYENMGIRAGCRMHLRMGYGSDPLSVPVVMNGFVSDLSVGDLITFVCVSDGVELTNALLSSKPNDVNGIFEDQESSNVISNMLCERTGFWNKINKKWGEPSKYSIEHFGTYFHEGLLGAEKWWQSIPFVNIKAELDTGRAVHTRTFTNEDQYDLCKNLYRGNYKKELFTYSGYWGMIDGEENLCFNLYNKTPWDAMQMSVQNTPEYLGMPMYHQFDSRFFYGLPVWTAKYRYNIINDVVYEECKTFAQMHFLDTLGEIIDNQVTTTSRDINTNAIVMYTRGHSVHATPTLFSDKSMDWSKMKTKIFDTSVTQNFIGPDALYEFFGIEMGKDAAIRVGISQLLYNWEKQYQGELIILGDGSIKPCDYIFINDSFIDMNGLCTARVVTHSLSANTGFVTTVTPGMIGFSTLDNSQMAVTLANAVTVGTAFSSYTAIRKSLKNSTEYLANYYNTAENWLFWGGLAQTALRIGLTVKSIQTSIKFVKASIKLIKNIKNTAKTTYKIIQTGQALDKISDAYKGIKTGIKTFKLGSLSLKTYLAGGGTIAAPGIGTIIGFAAGVLLDILLSKAIDHFAYNNCVNLLPLIYEGEAFAAIRSGDNLLMTNGTNMSEEEMSEEEISEEEISEEEISEEEISEDLPKEENDTE